MVVSLGFLDRERRARRRTRVLIVTENVSLARDHRARKQVGSLLTAGYDVAVICRQDPENAMYASAPGLRLYEYRPPRESSRKLAFFYEYAYACVASAVLALKAFSEGRFASIQAGCPPDILFLVALPFRLVGCRFLVDQRDLSPEVYKDRYGKETGAIPWLIRRLERLSWRSADHVFGVNRTLRDAIVARGAMPTASVSIVGNGPRLSSLHRRPPRPELKGGRQFLVCWVGVMGPQDHVDLALEMVDHLVHTMNRTDVHVAFIGDGEARDGLQDYADRLGITPWASFTGWLDEHRCFEYLSMADLALDTNLQHDVTPVKGMEYMGFGVPFVAFDLTETRTMADGAAVYVPPGDVPALARAVAALLDDPHRRAEMGAIGQRRIEQHLSWDIQQEAYLGVYAQLTGRTTDGEPVSTGGGNR